MSGRWPVKMSFWLAMVLLYSWPALWNGGPFFFPDSTNYVRAADAAVVSMTGHRSQWSDRIIVDSSRDSRASTQSGGAVPEPYIRTTRTVLNGRSIYYGALLYIGLAAGKYGPVLIQAGVAVATIALFLFGAASRNGSSNRDRAIVVGLLAIGIVSPLPFFLSRLMPDAFTGLLAVALVAAMVFWDEYSSRARAFLFAVAAAAILFHTTHILLTIALAGGAILLNFKARLPWRRVSLIPAILVALAIFGQLLFSSAVTRMVGSPPISPPFMSMRLIADGPGEEYLRSHCHERRFVLCDYLDRMPQESDALLWSENPEEGVFSTVSDPVKRALGRQDTKFFLAVLTDQPVEVLGSMIRSTTKLSVNFDLDHFNYAPAHKEAASRNLPGPTFQWVQHAAAFRSTVPIKPTVLLTVAATLVSLGAISLIGFRSLRRNGLPPPVLTAALLLMLAVVANIVICGMFSTPHARYLMRIIWLLPLILASLMAAGFSFRRLPNAGPGEKTAP